MAGAIEPIVLKPTANKHDGTVIFLHGLGDTGHGWSAGFDAIRQPNVKYIFPTASVLPVSLNGGFPMPSWFDIVSLDPTGKQDAPGIKKASDQLMAMIEKEIAGGLSSDKIAIGGFSQGGAVSLYTATVIKKPLAGVIALSAWLPLHNELDGDSISHKKTPVLQCHGDSDPMVPFSFGEMSYKLLAGKGGFTNYSFKKYAGMDHGSSNEEMLDVKKFIQGLFPQ